MEKDLLLPDSLKKKTKEELKRTKNELSKELEGIIGKETLSEFRQFAFKDNLFQMAIAFMLGAAFKKVVSGISDYLIMPIVNYVIGHTGSGWREMIWTPIEGLTFEVGKCSAVFVDFVLMAIILFIMWKKLIAPIFSEDKKSTKHSIKCIDTIDCPQCLMKIDYRAKRCPYCTSQVNRT